MKHFITTTFLYFIVFTLNSAYAVDLPSGMVPFSGPSAATHELSFIDSAAKKSDLVAISNCLHGSSEIDQVVTTLFNHLVNQHNYRILFFEWGAFLTAEIESVVNKGNCDDASFEESIISFMKSDYRSKEMVSLFRGICQFNKKNMNSPIHLAGFDVSWETPYYKWKFVLKKFENDQSSTVSESIKIAQDQCMGLNHNDYAEYEASEEFKNYNLGKPRDTNKYNNCNTALETLLKNSHSLGSSSSDQIKTDALARMALRALISMEGVHQRFPKGFDEFENQRDFFQAENLKDHWNMYPDLKGVMWAATLHAAKKQNILEMVGWNHITSNMQHTIKNFPSKNIYVVGMTGYQLSGIRGNFLLPTAEDSLDLKLHEFLNPYLYFETNHSYLKLYPEWFTFLENNKRRPNGLKMNPLDQYDSMIYVDSSNKSTAVKGPYADMVE